MELTPELKQEIDNMDVEQLLYKWRFAKTGDPIMQDESGTYWGKRMAELRSQDNDAWVRASKNIGWGN